MPQKREERPVAVLADHAAIYRPQPEVLVAVLVWRVRAALVLQAGIGSS